MAPKHRAVLSSLLLFIAPLLISARAWDQRDFAAADNAAILPTNGLAGHHERFYLPAIPAFPARGLENGLLPGRDVQEPINCREGNHTCLEAGPDGAAVCCPNDRYCFVDQDLQVKCCALGNVCSDETPCSDGQNYCVATTTITSTITPAPSASGTRSSDDDGPLILETPSTYPACCNRPCGTESFLCPTAWGNQCCENGLRCGVSGRCLKDVETTTAPPVANPIPSGCSFTYQFACDPTEGRGCCATGQTCRSPTFCDGEASAPTMTGANGEPILPVEGDQSLSPGAQAGIGVAVAAAGVGIIAALTFCWFRRRKGRAESTAGRHASTTLLSDGQPNHNNNNNSNNGSNNNNNGGGGGDAYLRPQNHRGSGSGSGSGSGAAARMRGLFHHMGPLSPTFHRRGGVGGGGGGGSSSEMSGPTSGGGASSGGGGGRPALHSTGLVYDYFGPQAVAGPYTTDEAPPRQRVGGVAVRPEGPQDIMTPVEIGSTSPAEPKALLGEGEGKADGRVKIVLGGGFGYREREQEQEQEDEEGLRGGAGAGGAGGGRGVGNSGGHGEDTWNAIAGQHGLFELVGSPPPPAASPTPPMSPMELTNEPRAFGAVSPSPVPTASTRLSSENPEARR